MKSTLWPIRLIIKIINESIEKDIILKRGRSWIVVCRDRSEEK